MAAADPKLQALLELERRGALNPQASQMLAAYRAQGTTKTKPLTSAGKPAAAGSGDVFESAKSRDSARSSLDLINRIQPQLNRVRDLYDRNLKGAGPMQSIREYLPSQSNSQFDNAVAGLRILVRPATRTPGEGAMSDFESKLAMQNLPERWSFDGANEEALTGLQRLLDTSRSDYSKRLGLPAAPPKKSAAPRSVKIDENGKIIP